MQFRFLRTESFRLTAIFAVLLVGSMVVLMASVYAIMHQAFRTELLTASDHDLASVQQALSAKGLSEAKEVVAQLLAKSATVDFLVLESTSRGKLAGNLPAMPPKSGEQIISAPASVSAGVDRGENHRIIGKGVFLAPGLYAFAGRDLSVMDEAEEDMLSAFGWVLAATLVLALAGGVFLSGSFLGRMDTITQTCRAIMAGRLVDRIPERGTRDEFDRLVMTINAMLDRIEALMENVQQISSDIAHDLRTPLTRLRHHLELARSESATVEEYAQAVDRAVADSDNILSTFSALLRIGQIEGHSEPSRFVDVDLSGLLTELAEIYRPAAEDSGYTLNASIEPSIAVAGNRELLSQMFSNLIENAVTHTPPGTAITIRLQKSGGRILASVNDTGPGIPLEQREKVFRRFYRLERARSRPGSGLGLSLVAAIAAYHQAQICFHDNGPGLRAVVEFGIYSGSQKEESA